jgi:hypothetical protein
MITFDVDARALQARFGRIATDQLPFAVARTITESARAVAEAQRSAMQTSLDRPTPFTLRGPAVMQSATKAVPAAVVGIRPVQAGYLQWQVHGGTRTAPAGRAVLVPTDAAPENRYGNLPKGYVARVLQSGRAFVASRSKPKTRHLPAGIYLRAEAKNAKGRRVGTADRAVRMADGNRTNRMELLVAFESRADYEPAFDFFGVAETTARETAARLFDRNFAQAVASAR